MSTFYFSGIEKKATAQVLTRECAAGMMSQLECSASLLAACGDMPLVIDSGAYSKDLDRRDIEDYAQLIQQLGERAIWYANADEIGSQEKSNENYHFLCSLLPTDLHPRILWIYQASAPMLHLHQALREHTRIGIGGLVPMFQAPNKTHAYQRLRQIAAIIAAAGGEPHYFGVSIPQVIQELHAYHACFSVDSTTWLAGSRYGQLVARNGSQRSAKELGYDFLDKEILAQNVRTMSKWMSPQPRRISISPNAEQLAWEVAV